MNIKQKISQFTTIQNFKDMLSTLDKNLTVADLLSALEEKPVVTSLLEARNYLCTYRYLVGTDTQLFYSRVCELAKESDLVKAVNKLSAEDIKALADKIKEELW